MTQFYNVHTSLSKVIVKFKKTVFIFINTKGYLSFLTEQMWATFAIWQFGETFFTL